MQFNYEIFSFYVKHTYCNSSEIFTMGWTEYGFNIGNYYFTPLHIIKLGETDQYNVVLECSNGFTIERKK